MTRSAWIDRGIAPYPIAAGLDGYLYYHEFGNDDGSANPPSAIASYIESSQMSIGAGEDFVLLTRLIPDITFEGSSASSPAVSMTLETRPFPGANYTSATSNTVTRSATAPVEQFTEQVFVRLRGRSFAFKINSSATGVEWRLGTPRVDIRPDGRR